jgi:MFS transporter, ACS family, DAL5 transporter family protein
MYLGIVNTGYATAFFTPTILHQLGWTAMRAQVMAIPIFIAAAALTLATAVVSDRIRHRFGFAALGCMITTVGYVMMLCQKQIPVGARYFALYAISCGSYMTFPICLAWVNNNMGGHYKRAISCAAQIGLGNFGGIIASTIFGNPKDGPTYYAGFSVSLALVWVCLFSCIAFLFHLRRENQMRARGERDYLLDLPEREVNNLGDDHPGFKFGY